MNADALYGFESLWRQYRRCRANKRNSLHQLAFEVDAEAQLLALGAELRAHRYRPGTSVCFVTGGPKPREVFAAAFRDRVVHHLLVSQQERIFEPRFIHDSYACRRGKGTLAASDRLGAQLRKVSANGRRRAWALQLDVASFFPSVDKSVLFELLCRPVRDPELRWLTRVVLFHDPTTDYRFRSLRRDAPPPGQPGYPVAREKSLFGKGNRQGLPIGNLTSQFWGNVYLDALDQYVKRTLRCRHYLRYVDDTVLLSESREELVAWRAAIAAFLDQRLQLCLRVQPKEIVAVCPPGGLRGLEVVVEPPGAAEAHAGRAGEPRARGRAAHAAARVLGAWAAGGAPARECEPRPGTAALERHDPATGAGLPFGPPAPWGQFWGVAGLVDPPRLAGRRIRARWLAGAGPLEYRLVFPRDVAAYGPRIALEILRFLSLARVLSAPVCRMVL